MSQATAPTLSKKICLNCLNALKPKHTESYASDSFRMRMYCGNACSIKMRRRIRNKQPHPEAVQAELDRRQGAGRLDVPSVRVDTVVFKKDPA